MSNIDDNIIIEPTGFGYHNIEAKVVIVGITPGNSQLDGSREGLSPKEIKCKYAFAGKMRPNLINMLNYIGVNRLLGIESCSTLWGDDFDKVDMTSLLVDATYELRNGKREMFRHAEKIAKSEILMRKMKEGFVENCKQYTQTKLFVACGRGVYDVLMKLKEFGVITAPVVAIAHPSGGNMKCIQYYLGKKESELQSFQWYIEKPKEAKEIIDSLCQ